MSEILMDIFEALKGSHDVADVIDSMTSYFGDGIYHSGRTISFAGGTVLVDTVDGTVYAPVAGTTYKFMAKDGEVTWTHS